MEIPLGGIPIGVAQSFALDGSVPVAGYAGYEPGLARFPRIPAGIGRAIVFLRFGVAEHTLAAASKVEASGPAPLLLHAQCRGAGGLGRALSRPEVRNLADCEGPPMRIEFLTQEDSLYV